VLNDKSENSYHAYAEVNIATTNNLALQAANMGVKRFIFISSIKVNGETTSMVPFNELNTPSPEDDYGKTKYEAENELRVIAANSNMEIVIIRPPLIYGKGVKANFKNLIKLCHYKLPLPFGAIDNKRSMVYIENLVDFIITCASHPKAANQTFLISDDKDVSTTELIQTIRQSLGLPALLIPMPQKWLVYLLNLIGKNSLAIRLCGNLQVDISKAKTLLDWKPPYTFKQGIQKTIDSH
jgi:UDP-glucose 4-epimerase